MACLPITCPLNLFRGQSNYRLGLSIANVSQVKGIRVQYIQAISKNNASEIDAKEVSNEESVDKASKKPQRAPRRSRKKITADSPEENSVPVVSAKEEEISATVASTEPKKVTRRGRKKATTPTTAEESNQVKVTKRRTRKKTDTAKTQATSTENSDLEESTSTANPENGMMELQLRDDEGEDISFTYSWPPLVCCFGAAQHAFIPSGRPANRLIDHGIHETKKDMFWSPTKFVRAPGRSSSSVAVALASIGGRVAFMGKVGDDEYGQNILYYLNVNNVQTRATVIDSSRPTAVSQMKITRRGGLRMTCVKPCAEDNFLSSEINIDVLKEAKMFYFNASSLINQQMRSTTMQAIRASKKLGGAIFFDLNLPMPLWNSSEETKLLIQEAWNNADFIEVTKQELEFLCGIEPMEKFDTKDNDRSKFIHHKPEVINPLWHENLKVLFVTNGTSKIHYYTEKDDGWVHGMEDAPMTPFTGDMSVSGDAIVAALMRMLTVQPDLVTDKGYLQHMIKYAIDCAVIDQWILARIYGFPAKQGNGLASSSENSAQRFITEQDYRTAEHPVEEPVG
ncbi:fructokinase-like 2, chloroplastic [Iris pallida]|uniref:Fructokinase-like 2, chloroplastic n=1 Tax=Iris pallida TaxID=29817 RepID=A0AAX6H425_IRIPA|nr:fructokinase-like 2, chloroplastic [Iris pallida]